MDHYGVRVSEGQKASFCLEDNDCDAEVSAVYDCENYGDQGITPGCKVIAIYSIMQIVLQMLLNQLYMSEYIITTGHLPRKHRLSMARCNRVANWCIHIQVIDQSRV